MMSMRAHRYNLFQDNEYVAAYADSESSTNSGTDVNMPMLIFEELTRQRSNIFDYRVSLDAIDAIHDDRRQVMRRGNRKNNNRNDHGQGTHGLSSAAIVAQLRILTHSIWTGYSVRWEIIGGTRSAVVARISMET